MPNLIQLLLAAQQGLANNAAPPTDPNMDEEIPVTGTIPPATKMRSNAPIRQIPSEPAGGNRTGRFGVGGTLRDILGTLSDGFLTQAGRPTVYGQRREQERMMDALGPEFMKDPNAAINRMANANPQAAINMGQAQQQIQQRQQQEDRYYANLERQTTKDNAVNFLAKQKVASNMLSAAKTPEDRKAIRDWLADPTSDVSGLSDEMLAKANMTPYQQDFSGPAAETNARAHMLNATRPRPVRPSPKPRSQTSLEYFQEVSKIPPPQRTPEQAAWMNSYINGKKGPAKAASGNGGWGTATKE